jgi:hypothetical protein
MSTSILPDGSLVVRLPQHTIQIDVRTRAIHIRAPSHRDELGGSILESYPQTAIDRVRLVREETAHHILLALKSKRAISLGTAPSHDAAMMTARVVADLTRCKVEVAQGVVGLPGPSAAFSAKVTFQDQQVRVIAVKPKSGAKSDALEGETVRIAMPPEPSKGKVKIFGVEPKKDDDVSTDPPTDPPRPTRPRDTEGLDDSGEMVRVVDEEPTMLPSDRSASGQRPPHSRSERRKENLRAAGSYDDAPELAPTFIR